MPDERKRLPTLIVKPRGYRLIRAFARENDMSISEAIRQLLKESPRLVEFAEKSGVPLDELDVNTWGGQRSKKTEDDDGDEE
jgi:hypothetical protein